MTRPEDALDSSSVQPVLSTIHTSASDSLRDPATRTEAVSVVTEGINVPDHAPCRSPVLSTLPENGVPTHVGPQVPTGIQDFAPIRQDTGSNSSMSENSDMIRSNRSSVVGQNFSAGQSQNTSDNPLQARQNQLLATGFDIFKSSLRTDAVPRQQESRRAPLDSDFANVADSLSWKIRKYGSGQAESDVAYVVICLHDSGRDESAWMPFAKQHLAHPQTAFLFLGGIKRIRAQTNGQGMGLHWSDEGPDGNTFQRATRLILEEVVVGILIAKCNIPPRNIALLGEGQGGTAAITMACAWGPTRLGGIVSLNGPSPEYIVAQIQSPKIPTPILVLGGDLGDISPQAAHRIRNLFLHVDIQLQTGIQDFAMDTFIRSDGAQLVSEFLAHALRQEEWETQAILTFDGGGIRGYGSLLVMRDLMRRVGIEEKRLDSMATSSFHPGIYKPTMAEHGPQSTISTADSQTGTVCATDTEGLEESDLFLPCHYFTYVGGTSTGGLIGIMLSRFRMSVNDCITEYKSLGRKVFAHPRPLSMGGLSWHKFSAQPLTAAIQDVTNRHCFKLGSFGVQFPSDPDFCRTVVLAYSENAASEAPYLFRTYRTRTFRGHQDGQLFGPGNIRRETTLKIHNPGAPPDVDISLVGRATSAAPTYFPPVRVPIIDSNGDRTSVRFKDGGFGSNNPSLEVFRDVKQMHGGLTKNVNIFVSIGTGRSDLKLFNQEGWTRAATRVRETYATLKALRAFPSRTQGAHNAMLDYATQDNRKIFPYFRFDGGDRLGQVKMDEWKSNRLSSLLKWKHTISGSKTLQDIEDSVAVYLTRTGVQSELDECAMLLVRRRRLRLRDKHRWDRYASASWYECPFSCNDPVEYKTYASFEDHIRAKHSNEYASLDYQHMEDLAENCRRCWLYPRKENATVSAAAAPAEV